MIKRIIINTIVIIGCITASQAYNICKALRSKPHRDKLVHYVEHPSLSPLTKEDLVKFNERLKKFNESLDKYSHDDDSVNHYIGIIDPITHNPVTIGIFENEDGSITPYLKKSDGNYLMTYSYSDGVISLDRKVKLDDNLCRVYVEYMMK